MASPQTAKTTDESPPPRLVPTSAVIALVALLLGLMVAAGFLPRIAGSAPVQRAIWGAAAIALVWGGVLVARRRPLTAELVIRRPHWVQVVMHTTIFVYWGLYVDLVGETAPLILVQIPLAYLIDLLLAWSRGRRWQLGFGPIPVIGSINLFLWFKDPWFHWQLVMVALAFLGRAGVQWTRDGRRRHIFNPSGLALTVVSIGVIAADASHLTWGEEIATTLRVAPYMFEVIFGVGLVVSLLFGVTWTTFAAAGTAWLAGSLWYAATGDWFFVDTTIPIAVFLGMNLLITDPATSPRNAIGKALFGALYGVLVFPLFVVLPLIGQPAFYDKLLQVPICNVLAPWLERQGARLGALWSGLRQGSTPWSRAARNRVAVGAWALVFVAMRPGLIDHPGGDPDVWRAPCAAGDAVACVHLRHALEKGCGIGRMEVCHALAVQLADPASLDRSLSRALSLFRKACDAGHEPSCAALNRPAIVAPTSDATADDTACGDGDGAACMRLAGARLQGPSGPDPAAAAEAFERACTAGEAAGCANLGLMALRGDGIATDPARAVAMHARACDLGLAAACGRLGVLYAKGVAGPPDDARARAAFERACRGGDQGSCMRVQP